MPNHQIESLIGQAIERFQHGDPLQSEALLLQALVINPNNLIALEILAFIKTSCGDLAGSQKYLKQILDIESGNANALRLLGVTYAQEGNLEKALEFLNQSIEANSNNGVTYSNFGNVLLELIALL